MGAFFGIQAQRGSARQASQVDVILASRLLDEDKLTEGLAYLVRAGRKDSTNPLVAPRLLSALSAHRFLWPTAAPLTLPSPALGGAFSQDGSRLVYQGEDRVVRIIDPASWRVVRELDFGQKVQRLGVRRARGNSEVGAALLNHGTIVVFDWTTGQRRFEPIHLPSVWPKKSLVSARMDAGSRLPAQPT